MGNAKNISAINELAASEGGVFTSAQARRFGIQRYALSYAANAGIIERLVHGAYRSEAIINTNLDELRAIYKLTNPDRWTHERMQMFDGFAVSGGTAAHILGIGDMHLTPYRITTPTRFNSRNENAIFSTENLTEKDIIWKSELPLTRVEKTIADLIRTHAESSLVADALIDAVRKYGTTNFDIRVLAEYLSKNELEELLATAQTQLPEGTRLTKIDQMGHVALFSEQEGVT